MNRSCCRKKSYLTVLSSSASATQVIPAIMAEVKSMTQFIRSPQFYISRWNPKIPWILTLLFTYLPLFLKFCRLVIFHLSVASFAAYTTTTAGNKQRRRATVRILRSVKLNAPLKYWKMLLPDYKLGFYYDSRKVFELGGCEESCLGHPFPQFQTRKWAVID